MALVRTVLSVMTNQGIPSLAAELTAEQDLGDNTIVEGVHLFLHIPSWLSFSANSIRRMEVSIHPRHTTGGNDFGDAPVKHRFQVPANQAYLFKQRVSSLPQFFRLRIYNHTLDYAESVSAWLELTKVT